MASPKLVLGVALMDEDHARLEALMDRAGIAKDETLPALLVEIEAETRAHFGREEELMRSRQAPVLSCHMVQHQLFLAQFFYGHEAVKKRDIGGLRHFLATVLPQLLADHVSTVDRVTAAFLGSEDDDPGRSAP